MRNAGITFRSSVSPLNTPDDPRLVALVRNASTTAFHLAMLIGAGLLLAGAVVNAVGIRNKQARPQEGFVRGRRVGQTNARCVPHQVEVGLGSEGQRARFSQPGPDEYLSHASPERVYLTWRSSAGTAVAVEFLPKSYVP